MRAWTRAGGSAPRSTRRERYNIGNGAACIWACDWQGSTRMEGTLRIAKATLRLCMSYRATLRPRGDGTLRGDMLRRGRRRSWRRWWRRGWWRRRRRRWRRRRRQGGRRCRRQHGWWRRGSRHSRRCILAPAAIRWLPYVGDAPIAVEAAQPVDASVRLRGHVVVLTARRGEVDAAFDEVVRVMRGVEHEAPHFGGVEGEDGRAVGNLATA